MTKRFRTWMGVEMAPKIKYPVFGYSAVVKSIAHMIRHVQQLGQEVCVRI